jgi:alkanesulfonate monooxygenase SsuD/methylene tetrahydromethanopterin reductase-like flavin-dependent oxidoreductase (luciferase family)
VLATKQAIEGIMNNNNKFKLGLFSANCSGGLAITNIPERWDNSWDNNLKLAQIADQAGLDFLLPIARWIGYGGNTDFHGSVLETITWATGLLANTENINVFATIHTSCNHPVVLAKQIATMDHIGKGRAGLNVVCGWNRPEYEALGQVLPDDHETRYEFGDEWMTIVKRLWQENNAFDFEGKYFNLKNTYSKPHPIQHQIPVINAAASPQGRGFAVKHADMLFTPVISLEKSAQDINHLKQMAQAINRSIELMTLSFVVCRPTRKEAEEFRQYYLHENADWDAVDNIIDIMFHNAHSFPKEQIHSMREAFAGGHGGFPLTGTPDDVANGLEQIYKIGFFGSTLGFVDYVKELPYFVDEVLPRLERKGIRVPFQQTGQVA